MGRHIIVGAGPVGCATAGALVRAGHQVRVVTRSGAAGAALPVGVGRVAADASDPDALAPLVAGADALYNCANPASYATWAAVWPPLAASLLATARSTGAVLVTMGNLYGYGPVDHPMTEADPLNAPGKKGRLRAQMWKDMLAAHQAGEVRATEARASDFFGPGVTANGYLGERAVPRLLAGKSVSVIGDPDVPHSWTYIPDVGRTLAVLGTDERAWGRPWHVPTAPARSGREMVAGLSAAAGVSPPRVRGIPRWVLKAAGPVSPLLRELQETAYQFERPFVIDSSAAEQTFGLEPTPLEESLAATVAWWQDRLSEAAAA